MRIDCHTHWGRVWVERDGDNPADWLAIIDAHDVTHAVVMPEIGLIHAGRIVEEHDRLAAACAKAGGRMLPIATANLHFPEEALPELERCLRTLGFRGMKFHPWLQGCSVSIPAMDEACEMAAHYDVPVIFHDGTPVYSLPSQMALLAQRHPRTQIVLGHCGLFEHWREAIASLQSADNLWGCLSGPQPAAMREILRTCDPTRLLWGTDFGFGLADPYPYRLTMMDYLGMTEEQRQLIFADNPSRLLHLSSEMPAGHVATG